MDDSGAHNNGENLISANDITINTLPTNRPMTSEITFGFIFVGPIPPPPPFHIRKGMRLMLTLP